MEIQKPRTCIHLARACLALAFMASGVLAQDPAVTHKFAPEIDVNRRAIRIATEIDHDDIEVLYERTTRLPFSGIEVTLVKVLDRRSGLEYQLALDQGLRPMDHSELMSVENEIRHQLFGTMHPDLHRRLIGAKPETPVEVMIKFAVEEEIIDKSELDLGLVTEGQLRERAKVSRLAVEERSRELLNSAATRYAFAMPLQDSVDGPFVSLVLPVRAAQRLARDDRVVFIGPSGEARIKDGGWPTIPQALPQTRTDSAHAFDRGFGVKVAVIEDGQLDRNENCFRIDDQRSGIGFLDDHITNCVGMIANRCESGGISGGWVGYAPEASVLVANGSGGYKGAYRWARNREVDVVSMSYHLPGEETNGSLHSRDEYFDYWTTQFPYPSVFVSAGNEAGEDAFASGKGFNFFGVGDVIVDADGNRCDDNMGNWSSWKNPTTPHDDREVPEIASPGSTHALLGRTFNGTSAATPATAGIAACLIGENHNLSTWPEAVRAILLATANYQQADGEDFAPNLDGRDGTGLTDAWYAVRAAQMRANNTSSYYRAHDYGTLTKSRFNGGYLNESWKVRTYTTSARIRVALTWNSKTTSSNSFLDADLDLRVYSPSGSLVASSSSWDSAETGVPRWDSPSD